MTCAQKIIPRPVRDFRRINTRKGNLDYETESIPRRADSPGSKRARSRRNKVAEQARKLGCSENTIYLWKKKYGGLAVNGLKELRELRQENNKMSAYSQDLRERALNALGRGERVEYCESGRSRGKLEGLLRKMTAKEFARCNSRLWPSTTINTRTR